MRESLDSLKPKRISLPIIITVIVVLFVVVAVLTLVFNERKGKGGPSGEIMSKTCEELKQQISVDFDQANFCEYDDDCRFIGVNLAEATYQCFSFVNINANESELVKTASEYYQQCKKLVGKCVSSSPDLPKVVCENKKCVESSVQ